MPTPPGPCWPRSRSTSPAPQPPSLVMITSAEQQPERSGAPWSASQLGLPPGHGDCTCIYPPIGPGRRRGNGSTPPSSTSLHAQHPPDHSPTRPPQVAKGNGKVGPSRRTPHALIPLPTPHAPDQRSEERR